MGQKIHEVIILQISPDPRQVSTSGKTLVKHWKTDALIVRPLCHIIQTVAIIFLFLCKSLRCSLTSYSL